MHAVFDRSDHLLWLALRHGSVTIACPQAQCFQGLGGKCARIIRVVEGLGALVFAFSPRKSACARTVCL